MNIEIFDVGHGACSVITCPNGNKLMIDCGHDSDRPWYPSTHFSGQTIEDLIISKFDEDHVSDLDSLMANTTLNFITRNSSISSNDLAMLKKENGMGNGIQRLHDWMKTIESKPSTGGHPDLTGIDRSYFYNRYPADFTDENNLSVVTIIEYSKFKILFGGDIENEGWIKLLENSYFESNLKDTNVFVASHHGRKSGCCEEVMKIAKPQIVIMSDKGKDFDSQETTDWYADRCIDYGILYGGRQRKVFTTRNDGDITITVGVSSWEITTSR